MRLTRDERARLRIKTIRAFDMTREEAERQRREKENAKRRTVTRDEYEANSLSRTKPWEAEGICRRTWERHRAKAVASAVSQARVNSLSSLSAHTCDTPTPTPAATPQWPDGGYVLIGASRRSGAPPSSEVVGEGRALPPWE